ncbi:hypothetical protein RhiirA4_472486 [Rhizophagus irregularis]|uniref:Uncharacterized protein n=1 Tax=Rhizophagus irregularis TaxID=588596 RepID=A0A2I1H515_9GLOM|nr:hypothetical protein RhiirA4_472486 [Rhizophagus irregularis]
MPGIQEEQYQYLQELSNKITNELHEILLKVYHEMIEEVEVNNESKEKPIEDEEEILWITTHSEINWEEIRVTWNEDFEEFLKQHICQKCGVSAQVNDLENWENNGMKCQYCIMNIEAERITDIYEEANMKYERCIKCNRKSMCYDKICKGCDSYNIGKCEYCYKEQVPDTTTKTSYRKKEIEEREDQIYNNVKDITVQKIGQEEIEKLIHQNNNRFIMRECNIDKEIKKIIVKCDKLYQKSCTRKKADEFKLWKVEISGNHVDPSSNTSFQDDDELLAINEVGNYWTEKPPKRHIHVLDELPVSTAQELLDQIVLLEESLNMSV